MLETIIDLEREHFLSTYIFLLGNRSLKLKVVQKKQRLQAIYKVSSIHKSAQKS